MENKNYQNQSSSVSAEEITPAKNAITALQGDSEQQLKLLEAIINSSPIGIFIVQDGRFRFVTSKFAEILGYNQEELTDSETLKYVYPEDRDRLKNNAKETLKSGYCNPYEYRVVTKNGEIKWILETVISVKYAGQRAALGNFMDITNSKIDHEQLTQANNKLQLLVSKFEKQNRLNSILTEMRDLLQACSSLQEIPSIIMSSMKKLFPQSEGALFLMSPSKSDLESVAIWGGFPDDIDDNVFSPDACWGLRRGRAYVVDNPAVDPICTHLKHKPETAYVCLPLMAKGDVLGLLHLRAEPSAMSNNEAIQDLKDTAFTISEYLSLAVANVKLSESLARQSMLDSLSGLYNRHHMEESLTREIQRALRKNSQIGIVMADIDYFKKFNDTYGHAAGDMVINRIGKLLKRGIRGADIASRYGGEEFVFVFPDCSLEDTMKRANEIRAEIKKLEIVYQGQYLNSITASMGIAEFPTHGVNIDELVHSADAALYRAKQAGRDSTIIS